MIISLRTLAVLLGSCVITSTGPVCIAAQVRPPAPTRAPSDSATTARNLDNLLAVLTSGTWEMDGEYKGPTGIYYKLTGYFAYVGSTPTSKDAGDRAVMAMYLEPMSGGAATWLSAHLGCERISGKTRCVPAAGAKSLLDLNIIFSKIPFRGDTVTAEITEPDDKTIKERFTSRFSSRGKFTMRPPQ